MRLEILEDSKNTSKDEKFKLKLKQAKNTYLRLVFPYNHDIVELPDDRAKEWQTECAIELYNLGGDKGVISYSENGLSETKAKAGLSQELLNKLPPARAGAIM